jgi:hypothetical protein
VDPPSGLLWAPFGGPLGPLALPSGPSPWAPWANPSHEPCTGRALCADQVFGDWRGARRERNGYLADSFLSLWQERVRLPLLLLTRQVLPDAA